MKSLYFLHIFCALLLLFSSVQVVAADGGYVYATQWGRYGGANGEFEVPTGIAVDNSGNVYVVDSLTRRIQKFTSDGDFILKWGGHSGTENGAFSSPHDIAVDSSGSVYVADTYNNRIQKFTSNGIFITKWTWFGDGGSYLYHPNCVAVDNSGNVYVVDTLNPQPLDGLTRLIRKFTSSGTFIMQWGKVGYEDGQITWPTNAAVDSAGNVYTTYGNRVQKFTSSGTSITNWSTKCSGITVDSADNVYVVDSANCQIRKFTSSGTLITEWGSEGHGDGQFSGPSDIAVDKSGNVYVAETGNSRIQKFTPEPAPAPPSPTVTPAPTMPLIPSCGNAPQDLNHDGLFEDLNGNGAGDFNDVVLFFNNMDWIADNEPISAFDFNHNGTIDFNDIVILFNEM